jgi:2-C-methyl-D-erythritol 2,4-cyclodiphosphate synthase
MRARVAELLQVQAEAVNIKAKTAEGLGPVGQSQSMEAHVVLLLAQAG